MNPSRLFGWREVVEAAGGVVWRTTPEGSLQVALVHRPRYDDWSFPKGKLLPGESLEQAAMREVEEETGLLCRRGDLIGRQSYRDRKRRRKMVTYWLMERVGGQFAPSAEVDQLRWLPVAEAVDQLTYGRDRELLKGLRIAG